MQLETIVVGIILATMAVYAAAWITLLTGKQRLGTLLFGAGWIINAGLVALNWVAGGHPPFGNMYHVLIFLSLCFLPAYIVLRLKDRIAWLAVYFAFVSVIPLLGSLFMETDIQWSRAPALQSPWFVPHVVAYVISYSLAAVAFALTVAGIFRRKGAGVYERYSEASYHTIRLAFPFMTFGLCSGALWAEEAWGVYWSWDPKETWSLITWLLYIIYFHCRTKPSLMKYAIPAQTLAFIALLTTFLLVNLLPKLSSVLHSYAMM